MPGASELAELSDGSRVELHGLSKAQFNGLRGVARGHAANEKGRWNVVLGVSGKQMAVKPCNLCAPTETWKDGLELRREESRGCQMRQSQGVKWYTRLNCLCAVAARQIGARAATKACPPLSWNPRAVQLNDLPTRSRVLSYVLSNHATVLAAAEEKSPSVLQLMAECLDDRRPTDAAVRDLIEDMRGWSVHVEGDFYVEGFTDKGAVFVRVPSDQQLPEEVYIVQACATPFTELLAPLERRRASHDVTLPAMATCASVPMAA